MTTTTTPLSFEIDEEHVVEGLQAVRDKLATVGGEVLLDFFFTQQLDPSGLQVLEALAGDAEVMKVKVVLRGINVDVYKVLKLAGLDGRFVFVD